MITQQLPLGSASKEAFSTSHLELFKELSLSSGFLRVWLLLPPVGRTCWRNSFLHAGTPRMSMHTTTASLKMGLGCACPAVYLAFSVWLNLGLFCIFAEFWCLLLIRFCLSRVLLLTFPSGTMTTQVLALCCSSSGHGACFVLWHHCSCCDRLSDYIFGLLNDWSWILRLEQSAF